MFRVALDHGEEVTFLTLDQLLFIHKLALTEGGLAGAVNTGYLEGALSRPRNVLLYEGETDLVRLASYLWHGVGTAHAFVDGNKRTATLAAMVFLEVNGIEPDATADPIELGNFVEACFRERRFQPAVLDHWLRTRCRWIAE